MTTLHHEIHIDAPVEAVWHALVDLTAVGHYNPAVATVEYASTVRSGVGAERRCELRPNGWVRERVVGWEPMRAVTMEVVESTWPITFMRWTTSLAPDGARTRVVQQLDYRPKFGVLGALMDLAVMRRAIDRAVAGTFVGLKRYVEGGSVAGTMTATPNVSSRATTSR